MEPWQFVLLGIAAAGLGYSLWQGTRYRRSLERQDTLSDTMEEVRELENSARGIVQQLEVRAYDYSREVEARIDNRLAVLDQLILDADQEIRRLQSLLSDTQRSTLPDRMLTPAEQQRCFALHEAGLSHDEIARCVLASVSTVKQALDEWSAPRRKAA